MPEFVQQDFGSFYKATFSRTWEKHDRRAIVTEYAWNMGWCDPCAAPPLEAREMRELGVFWLDQNQFAMGRGGGGMPVMLTRLHVRYDAKHFPEDLMFQETGDQQNFQGRYVLHHPFKGEMKCEAAAHYLTSLRERQRREADTVASLTGWTADTIQTRMGPDVLPAVTQPWWKKLWK